MKFKSAICLLTSLTISATALVGCSENKKNNVMTTAEFRQSDSSFDSMIKASSDFVSVAETEKLQLFVSGATAEIKVLDKTSGKEWFSNPKNRNYASVSSEQGVDVLNAQVNIEYNVNDKTMQYNSYTDAVLENQYNFEQTKNGIRVNYLLGKKEKVYYVPKILSIKRYKELTKKMTKEQKSTIKAYYRYTSLEGLSKTDRVVYEENYPILKERNVFIALLTDNLADPNGTFASDYLMTQLDELFSSVGYTPEKYYADIKENLLSETKPQESTVALSVEYSIDGDSFKATVPNKSISYDSTYIKFMSLTLLPYFGAADSSTDGYMFVPDGSGAIINLNSAKHSVNGYSKRVYGQDASVSASDVSNIDIEQIYLPIFGMHHETEQGQNGFLAIIENGDAIAEIQSNIAGKVSSYNTVSSKFCVNQTQKASEQTLGVSLGQRYQEENASCDISIKYLFLSGEDSNYCGMALKYRDYLIKNKKIGSSKISSDIPIYVSTIGAVDAIKTVAGIPVNAQVSLTSYKQNIEIAKELKQAGVENLIWNTCAWCNYGVRNTAFSKLSFIGELGGKTDYKALVDYMSKNGIPLFAQVNMQSVTTEKWFDGFDSSKNAARNLENATAYVSEYSLVTRTFDETQRRKIVNPLSYNGMLTKFIKKYSKYGNFNLNIGSLASSLYGNYYRENITDRQEALELVKKCIEKNKNGYSFSSSGANSYALSGVDLIYDMPTRSSREYIFDKCIPFYQIAVRSLIPYASKAMNLSSEYDTEVLRLIETGTIPSFSWIYEDNSILKNTDFNYYSVNYKNWIEKAADLYGTVNGSLSKVANASIIKHEYLSDSLVCTTYDNGIKIYVNYGESDAIADFGTVPAQNYLCVG